MGPYLGTRVPTGTLLAFWVPIGSLFIFLGPYFQCFGFIRGPTEDIIHYFTLMSSELHYLDIILKIENLTLMSSASGKFDINVLSIWENHLSNTHIFVILPVLFLFSHVLNAGEQLQLLIYALLSLKCRELHLRVF